jgi:RecA/RadA recombinase
MAKTKTVNTDSEMQDDLASVLADNLNKKFKNSNYKVAYFLEGDTDAPSEVTEWISTGSTMLDLAISNRPHGGLPVGRIIEITGLEASGKSLLAAHALADTQRKGGLAVYIDTENAISREFLEAIGVNLKDMLYVPLETVEDIFEAMDTVVESVRKSSKSRIVTIVVDSVAGASTKQEMSADYDKDGWATSKAIILSKAMRKITNFVGRERICLIFTNQLRTRLGVTFGDQWCVDPFTTKVKIRYQEYIEEEITLAELSERFLLNNDFTNPEVYDMKDLGIEVLTLDTQGNEIYKPILNFVVKDEVTSYYTDGKLNGTAYHRIIEDGSEIHLKDHADFKLVNDSMKVVDIEVEDLHSYLANGRLNHNTTSGGKAIAFHSSVRLRLKSVGQIKLAKSPDRPEAIVGITTRAQVIKNRMGPPLRTVDYDIYFDSGIDDYGSWLTMLKNFNLVTQSGAWYTYTNTDTGEVIKFQSKDFKTKLIDDTEMRDQVYRSICEKYILNYKAGDDFGIDDIEIETDFSGEES